ncbi:MAG: hypothetical protein AB2A00_08280 [Myxococcota bacterium]
MKPSDPRIRHPHPDLREEAEGPPGVERNLGRARVLLIGYDETVLPQLVNMCGNAGYEIQIEPLWSHAVHAALVSHPDAILVVAAPQVDPVEVARAMMRLDPDMSVVILDANPTLPRVMAAWECGVSDYIQVPLPSLRLLQARIERAVSRGLARNGKEEPPTIPVMAEAPEAVPSPSARRPGSPDDDEELPGMLPVTLPPRRPRAVNNDELLRYLSTLPPHAVDPQLATALRALQAARFQQMLEGNPRVPPDGESGEPPWVTR